MIIRFIAWIMFIPFSIATGVDEIPDDKPGPWGPNRLSYEFHQGGRSACIILVAGISLAIWAWLYGGSQYWGAVAGALALLAVIASWTTYFRPARPRGTVLPPNPFVTRCAGYLLAMSAFHWLLDGLRVPMGW